MKTKCDTADKKLFLKCPSGGLVIDCLRQAVTQPAWLV